MAVVSTDCEQSVKRSAVPFNASSQEEQLKNETYPIVKWVGGKRQLIFELLKNMPKSYNRYFEPFIGGGALFFELQPDNAYISDMNKELINLYQVVRDNVDELIKDLQKHNISKEYFMEIRNIDRTNKYENWSNIQKASRFNLFKQNML